MALYGIYGRHEIDTFPWNNKENAKRVIPIANSDMSQMLPRYKINKIIPSIPFRTLTHIALDS